MFENNIVKKVDRDDKEVYYIKKGPFVEFKENRQQEIVSWLMQEGFQDGEVIDCYNIEWVMSNIDDSVNCIIFEKIIYSVPFFSPYGYQGDKFEYKSNNEIVLILSDLIKLKYKLNNQIDDKEYYLEQSENLTDNEHNKIIEDINQIRNFAKHIGVLERELQIENNLSNISKAINLIFLDIYNKDKLNIKLINDCYHENTGEEKNPIVNTKIPSRNNPYQGISSKKLMSTLGDIITLYHDNQPNSSKDDFSGDNEGMYQHKSDDDIPF